MQYLLRSVVLVAASTSAGVYADPGPSTLADARRGHVTQLTKKVSDAEPFAPPPGALFSLVQYPGPLGPMNAYLGVDPKDGKKRPAIIWITGGFPPGGVGSSAWQYQSSANDQSAKSYREAGLIMMYPGLRGSMGNPGQQETFFGEVDDVLAATAYLAQVPYVDADRIYLGGHSTGGTLALLAATAAAPGRFEAVFAFGPIDDPSSYSQRWLTYDPRDAKEGRLRSPIAYLDAIRSPAFVVEGVGGNIEALRAMKRATKNRRLAFLEVEGVNHFDVLGPSNAVVAGMIRSKKDGAPLALTAEALGAACASAAVARREGQDLETLSQLRSRGSMLSETVELEFYVVGPDEARLAPVAKAANAAGFMDGGGKTFTTNEGSYAVRFLRRRVRLGDLSALFAASASASAVAERFGLRYDGWWKK